MIDFPPLDPTPIIVTAARTEQSQSDSATSNTLIGPIAIQRLGEPLALDLLRLTPSASVSVAGTAGSQAQLRIRGSEANHTLLFVDGIRANDPAAANEPRFELLNADLASRIEVVRGPQSALWGSEAIGGVVAIDADPHPAPSITGEIGSNGFYRSAGNVGVREGALTMALGAGVQGSNGLDAFDTPGEGDRDGYWNVALRGRAALSLGDEHEIGVNGFAIRANNEFDGFDPESFAHADTSDNTRNRLAAGRIWYARKRKDWDARLSASLLSSTNRNFLDELFLNRSSAKRWSLSGQLTRRFVTGSVQHSLTGALDGEWERYRAKDDAFGGFTDQNRSRRHWAGTAEWQAKFGDWLVTDFAVRHDAFNRFKDATTARASALVRFEPSFALTASWGQGIAQPSFTDLYGFFPGGYEGNPNVKPERSRGWEAGARYTAGTLQASLTYFRQRLNDEIVENETFTSVINADGTSKRQGIEAETRWSPGEWLNLTLGYSWLDATQQTVEGQPSVREHRRPRHSGFASADGQVGRLTYGLSLSYVGSHIDRRDSFPYELVRLDSYWLAGARLGWQIHDRIELFGRVHNALNADYEDVVGYRTEGRSVFGGIRVAFDR